MKFRNVLIAQLLVSFVTGASAGEIIVAVASNFIVPMNQIAATFERETGHRLQTAFGSSGKLYAQIINGAPFHAFLSADHEKPLLLEEEGFAVAGSRFTYATGALALWSAKPGLVDRHAMVLKELRFNRLALANPMLAPYGVAAVEVLQHFGIVETSQSKLVQGENIAQTYQFVHSGNADLGFVALSQIMDGGEIKNGSAWVVPSGLHKPIRQDAVLLKAGANSEATREFLRFMGDTRAKSIIGSHGYRTEST